MKVVAKMEWNGAEVKIQGHKVVNKTAFETGLVIEGQAKLLCPIDFGYLAASINTQSSTDGTELGQVKPNPEKHKFKKVERQRSFWEDMPERFEKITKPAEPNVVRVGTVVEYGPYIEFGTVNMDAQPFLRPAMDMAKGKMMTLLYEKGKHYFADYLRRPK